MPKKESSKDAGSKPKAEKEKKGFFWRLTHDSAGSSAPSSAESSPTAGRSQSPAAVAASAVAMRAPAASSISPAAADPRAAAAFFPSSSGAEPEPPPPQSTVVFVPAPRLLTVAPAERPALLQRQLQQCGRILFNFVEDADCDARAKDLKRAALVDIADLFASGQQPLNELLVGDVVDMFKANVFRTLPPPSCPNAADYDPDEDEPTLVPSWPHMQLVYELFLRFLECPDFQYNIAKPHFNQAFIIELLEIFDSEDPRERDFLKTILHRVYGKFLPLRAFIRRSINNTFSRFVFELPQKHNGIAELLEILGSIINGFACPLKEEHRQFLLKVLMPLHKVKQMGRYHPQLVYCVVQFLEKEPALASPVIQMLMKFWPRVNSSKQVMFINQLEELLELTDSAVFATVHLVGGLTWVDEIGHLTPAFVPSQDIFQHLSLCVGSPHFQVAERTLYLFNSQRFVALLKEQSVAAMAKMLSPLVRQSKAHWNPNIVALLANALKVLWEVDKVAFDQQSQELKSEQIRERERKAARAAAWSQIEKQARLNPAAQKLGAVGPVAQPTLRRGASRAPSRISSSTDAFMDQTELADVVGKASKAPSSASDPSKALLRRKSILPRTTAVQSALASHQSHSVAQQVSREAPQVDDDDVI